MHKRIIVLSLVVSVVFFAWPAKSQQHTRMLVLGDSLSRGLYAADLNSAYAARVARELGIAHTVGYGGTAVGVHSKWVNEYHNYQPDLIIVEVGLNDIVQMNYDAEAWRPIYGALLDDLQASGARVVVCTMFHAVKYWHPNYSSYLAFNEVIKEEAAARGMEVADLWAATYNYDGLLAQPADIVAHSPFYGDNFHPNDEGHKVIAETLLGVIGYNYYLPAWFGNQQAYP